MVFIIAVVMNCSLQKREMRAGKSGKCNKYKSNHILKRKEESYDGK